MEYSHIEGEKPGNNAERTYADTGQLINNMTAQTTATYYQNTLSPQ